MVEDWAPGPSLQTIHLRATRSFATVGAPCHLDDMASQEEGRHPERALCKNPSKKSGTSPTSGGNTTYGGGTSSGELVEEDTAPITRSFREVLFAVLQEDLATLRQEIATEVKELKSDVAELGKRVDMERTHDAQEKELDHYRQEILTFQDSNCELQYRLEDLEKRSCCYNIHIRGVPTQAMPGSLEDFVIHLFRHVVTGA
ncbi:hypothetical protein NDU88_002048 [Pleurodeles waltl]|uniref:Uncharacterized protein n=1 Tax=Pleurodeles waltl TaxID=8319 RepID=A0AAV7WK53_PLEWA|nr:hypothetical protein NDU88_002048 [Pleurodeles waltl]